MKRKILAGLIAVAVVAAIAIAVYVQKTKQPTPGTSQPVASEISNTSNANENTEQDTDSLNTASAETNESATTINNSDSDIDKSSKNVISEENENCVLRLGLTREELKSELNKLKMPILKEYQGRDDYNNYSGFWVVYTKDFEIDFNPNNQLIRISVINSDLPTLKGLKRGDTIEKMHELYGKESYYDKDWDMYVYKMKNCNFGVIYNLNDRDNDVDAWIIFAAE